LTCNFILLKTRWINYL